MSGPDAARAVLAQMTAAGVTDTSEAVWWASAALSTSLHASWPAELGRIPPTPPS